MHAEYKGFVVSLQVAYIKIEVYLCVINEMCFDKLKIQTNGNFLKFLLLLFCSTRRTAWIALIWFVDSFLFRVLYTQFFRLIILMSDFLRCIWWFVCWLVCRANKKKKKNVNCVPYSVIEESQIVQCAAHIRVMSTIFSFTSLFLRWCCFKRTIINESKESVLAQNGKLWLLVQFSLEILHPTEFLLLQGSTMCLSNGKSVWLRKLFFAIID